MSANIPTHYVQEFATAIQLNLQQKGSRLRNAVMTGTHVGKQASPVDQFGAVEMQAVSGRFNAMNRVDASTDRRWVFPSDFDLPQLIDSYDKLRLLTDPTSSYVQNATNAAGRKFDQLILAAAIGTAKTGESGSTSTALPSAQQIAVSYGASSDVGLTVAKLIKAKEILMAADVDLDTDELYCPISAKQNTNLIQEVQIISREFNGDDVPVLKDGRVYRFLGINFIHTELAGAAAQQSSGDVLIPVWAKSGMYLGLWNDITTDISQRKDLQGLPWQSYVYMTAGATRLEEEKVVQIACNI